MIEKPRSRAPRLPLSLSMLSQTFVSYEVTHTPGPMFDLNDDHLAHLVGGRPVIIIVDETIADFYGEHIRAYAKLRLDCREFLCVPGQESAKTLESAIALCNAAFETRLPRDGVLVAVGGGTVMDLVGFVASIYRRGIGYVRVPTTLIGMIDVSVGIKQGVNVRDMKNIVGSFYAPLGVLNDQTFLATLPPRHLACGIAEAVKIALVSSKQLFLLLERFGPLLLQTRFQEPADVACEILRLSELAMIDQLSSNLYERDRRRLADFGHTFSSTIETASGYEVPHGEAVAMDMLLSAVIGVRAGVTPARFPLRLARLFDSVGLPHMHPTMTLEAMSRALVDIRLHRDGQLNLVVPSSIGLGTFLQDVSPADLERALDTVAQLASRVRA